MRRREFASTGRIDVGKRGIDADRQMGEYGNRCGSASADRERSASMARMSRKRGSAARDAQAGFGRDSAESGIRGGNVSDRGGRKAEGDKRIELAEQMLDEYRRVEADMSSPAVLASPR